MSTAIFARVTCLVVGLWFLGASLRAEDWKTTDGKVYKNVTVLKSEPDAITILYSEGGALVPLAKLPPDLQKRFDYDPVKAKPFADARAKTAADDAKALAVEKEQAKKLQDAREAKYKAEQKAAAKADAAGMQITSGSSMATPDFVDPKTHVDHDILGPEISDQPHRNIKDALDSKPVGQP